MLKRNKNMETIEVEKGVFYRFESYDSEVDNETIETDTIGELIEKIAKRMTSSEHFYVYSYHLYEIPYYLINDDNGNDRRYIPADENDFLTVDSHWQCYESYTNPEKCPKMFLSKILMSDTYKAFKKQEAERKAQREESRKKEELARKRAEIARLEQELNEAKKELKE